MRRTIKYILVALLGNVGLNSVSTAQTVSLADLPYFFGKYQVKDSVECHIVGGPAQIYYLGTCLAWWRDSVNEANWPVRLTKWDSASARSASVKFIYNSLMLQSRGRPVVTCADSFPELKVIPQLFYDYSSVGLYRCCSYLTMWERAGSDSARYLCSLPLNRGRWNFDSMWVDGTYILPDSSLLVHVRYRGEGYSARGEGADLFVRYCRPDSMALLHETEWDLLHDHLRIAYDLGVLLKGYPWTSYTAVMTTQYMDSAHLYNPGKPTQIDSVHSGVIDLWQLAVQKFGIDTTNLRTVNH